VIDLQRHRERQVWLAQLTSSAPLPATEVLRSLQPPPQRVCGFLPQSGVSSKVSVTPQDFLSTIGHAMGLPVDEVVMSPSNRPFTVGDQGKPVMEVFA
jgi:hypothetical protein